MNNFVSVIIPVYNDPERLETCLRALEDQTFDENRYEVIVIDNNSDQKPLDLYKRFPNVLFDEEKTKGAASARNRGISLSKGDILAFTDSDCIPEKEWLENGVRKLLDNNCCVVVGGRIRVFSEMDEPGAIELTEMTFALNQKKFVEVDGFAVTANMFTLKEIINKVGLFESSLLSGEDREWGQRAYRNGFKMCYSENVCVNHPARSTFKQLYNKIKRYAAGKHVLNTSDEYPGNYYEESILRELVPPVIRLYGIYREHEGFKKIKSRTMKLKVMFILLLQKYLYTWERIRLTLRGNI